MDKIKFYIKDFLRWFFVENRYGLLMGIFLMFIVAASSCALSEHQVNKMYREKQEVCEHDYRELYEYENGYYKIYCPKCQLQENVHPKDWNRIKIDMEYNKTK